MIPNMMTSLWYLELLLRTVFAFPNASISGLLSMIRVATSSPEESVGSWGRDDATTSGGTGFASQRETIGGTINDDAIAAAWVQ